MPGRTSTTLYVEYRAYVVRCLLRAGLTRDEAEDATQEVFLRVHLNWAQLSHVVDWRAWFRVVTTRAAISWKRRARHKHERPWDSAVETAPLSDPSEVQFQDDATAVLQVALSALPSAMRSLLVLHYLEQVPAKKLAELTERPLATVYARLKTARLQAARRARLHRILNSVRCEGSSCHA